MIFSEADRIKHITLAKVVPWLVIISLALFPVGRSAEIPLALLALVGLKVFWEMIRGRHREKSQLLFSFFFLCLWLPIVFSVPDSYKLSKTSSLIIEYLRFFLAGLAIIRYCINSNTLKLINRCCLIILSFWIFDGLVQFFFGADLFGYVASPQRLNGIFGHKIKLGLFLAAYSSFLISLLYNKKYIILSVLLNLAGIVVLLLAGSRAGWIMYSVILTVFFAYKWRNNLKMFAISLGIILLSSLAAGTALYYNSHGFAARIDTTLQVFNGDEKSVDEAISLRLPIWRTAVSMIKAHPINGVGARAFRYAYPSYAKEGDIFLKMNFVENGQKIGALHSHQMELEVLSETGLIGGILFLAAMAILIWYWFSRSQSQKYHMLPYALGVCAIFFPFNTHFALYSSAWAQVIFWFIPLYFAAGSIDAAGVDVKGTYEP